MNVFVPVNVDGRVVLLPPVSYQFMLLGCPVSFSNDGLTVTGKIANQTFVPDVIVGLVVIAKVFHPDANVLAALVAKRARGLLDPLSE